METLQTLTHDMAVLFIVGLAVFIASIALWLKSHTLYKTLKSNQNRLGLLKILSFCKSWRPYPKASQID
jgi:hypothetical protein